MAVLLLLAADSRSAQAHPASGIVVGRRGEIYFTDVRRGLLKISPEGQLTLIHREGFHWITIDFTGAFSAFDFDHSPAVAGYFKRRTPSGAKPVLITASDSPIAVGPTGELYFVCDDDQMKPGMLQIARVTPDGKKRLVNPELRQLGERFGGIRDLAIGPDGSLYASYAQAVVAISADGKIASVISPITITDCEKNPPTIDQVPFLRGIAVMIKGSCTLLPLAAGGPLRSNRIRR